MSYSNRYRPNPLRRTNRSFTQIRRRVNPQSFALDRALVASSSPSAPPVVIRQEIPMPQKKTNNQNNNQNNKRLTKIERTLIGAWNNVLDVISEPFVLVCLAAAVFTLLLSSESKINGIITRFLQSHNIPQRLIDFVPRIMHYMFAVSPLISLSGRRRWFALASAGAICYVMTKEEYVAYAILGVAVRLVFQARTMQVGFMLLVAVFAVLAVYHTSIEPKIVGTGIKSGTYSNSPVDAAPTRAPFSSDNNQMSNEIPRNKRSVEQPIRYPPVKGEQVNDSLVPT